MLYGIKRCYLPPGSGDFRAFTPAEAGIRFSHPGGMQGWVDLSGDYILRYFILVRVGSLNTVVYTIWWYWRLMHFTPSIICFVPYIYFCLPYRTTCARGIHMLPSRGAIVIRGTEAREGPVCGGQMASAECEPITGVWGRCPQRGPGAEPLVRGSGAKLPEAERFSPLECPKEASFVALSGSYVSFAVTAKPKLSLCTAAQAPKP